MSSLPPSNNNDGEALQRGEKNPTMHVYHFFGRVQIKREHPKDSITIISKKDPPPKKNTSNCFFF